MPSVILDIGAVPILVRTADAGFARMLEERYAGFVDPSADPHFELQIEIAPPSDVPPDADVDVRRNGRQWTFRRGDFRAEWDADAHRGTVRQTANPYAIDSVLRILHTLLLSRDGGFLVHAASAIRDGKAFLFAGVSGAGKTTISRLAPPGVHLLTDEVSYVRRTPEGYLAFGTPFAGELAKVGENLSATIAGLYLLAKGAENSITPVSTDTAARHLLQNILFFAEDAELVKLVFTSACDFVGSVPVYRLSFVPDSRVWELIH